MIPTAQQLLTLMTAHKSFLTPAGADDIHADGWVSTPHLVNLLIGNYGVTVNPVAAPQIPKPIGVPDLIAAAPAAISTLSDTLMVDIGARIREGDRVGIAEWANVLTAKNLMTPTEQTAVLALVSATIPDPSWPTHVSLLEGAGYSWDDTLPATIDAALGRAA